MPPGYLRRNRGLLSSYDWKLVGIYLILMAFGLINIYASVHSENPVSIFDSSVRSGMQSIWIGSSLVLAVLILFVLPYKWWEAASLPMYVVVVFLLVAVIFAGTTVKGSHSWFSFGAIRFQPAEISKITTSLLLAHVMSQSDFKIGRWNDFAKITLIIGIPMLAILAENETGSALVYIGFIFVLYREGLSGWILGFIGTTLLLFFLTLTSSAYTAMAVLLSIIMLLSIPVNKFKKLPSATAVALILAICLLPKISEALGISVSPVKILLSATIVGILAALYVAFRKNKRFYAYASAVAAAGMLIIFSTEFVFNNVLQDHQRKRIEVLLGIKEDPAGVGYNVNQSMIAIGSGGFSGKGYMNGTQTAFGFVPEQSTDFIFCTVGEEWGFIGCFVVIALYTLLIFRIISNAEASRQSFTRIYGYCVAACLFMHLFINIGMTIGIMPVIGIPLPMMSYGGSSLWGFTILIFIFVALDHQEKKYF